MKTNVVYLSRKNLLDLLNKLDANKKQPDTSKCTIIKTDTSHPKYPCSDIIHVVALEDEEYYTDRKPGHITTYPL